MDDRKHVPNSVGRLLENPGRMFFIRGVKALQDADPEMPDSHTPEFYYLVQQKARLELVNTIPLGRTLNPFRLMARLFRGILNYYRLKTANALVQAYLNELRLMELSRKPAPEANAPDRDTQA